MNPESQYPIYLDSGCNIDLIMRLSSFVNIRLWHDPTEVRQIAGRRLSGLACNPQDQHCVIIDHIKDHNVSMVVYLTGLQ